MPINKDNIFKSIQYLLTQVSLAENLLKVAFTPNHVKKIEALLNKASKLLMRLSQNTGLSLESLDELCLKLQSLYGKTLDHTIEANIDSFYLDAYTHASNSYKRRKLRQTITSFLKNYRLNLLQNERIQHILTLLNPKQKRITPCSKLSYEEMEILLETAYLLASDQQEEGQKLFLNLKASTQERFFEELKHLKGKDLLSSPKKSSLGLLNVLNKDQGIEPATTADLNLFLKERKAVEKESKSYGKPVLYQGSA